MMLLVAQTVSKEHAEIEAGKSHRSTFISDLGSSNNTRLNGVTLRPGRLYELGDGSRLDLGQVTAIYRIHPPSGNENNSVDSETKAHATWKPDSLIPETPDSSRNDSSANETDTSFVPSTQQQDNHNINDNDGFRRPSICAARRSGNAPIIDLNVTGNKSLNTSDNVSLSDQNALHSFVDDRESNSSSSLLGNIYRPSTSVNEKSDNEKSNNIYEMDTQTDFSINSNGESIYNAITQRTDFHDQETQQTDICDQNTQRIEIHDEESQRTGIHDGETQRTNIHDQETQKTDIHEEETQRTDVHNEETQQTDMHDEVTQRVDDIHDAETQQNDIHNEQTQRIDEVHDAAVHRKNIHQEAIPSFNIEVNQSCSNFKTDTKSIIDNHKKEPMKLETLSQESLHIKSSPPNSRDFYDDDDDDDDDQENINLLVSDGDSFNLLGSQNLLVNLEDNYCEGNSTINMVGRSQIQCTSTPNNISRVVNRINKNGLETNMELFSVEHSNSVAHLKLNPKTSTEFDKNNKNGNGGSGSANAVHVFETNLDGRREGMPTSNISVESPEDSDTDEEGVFEKLHKKHEDSDELFEAATQWLDLTKDGTPVATTDKGDTDDDDDISLAPTQAFSSEVIIENGNRSLNDKNVTSYCDELDEPTQVIDSNLFKRNEKTPTAHKEIIEIEAIKNGEQATASSSDQVDDLASTQIINYNSFHAANETSVGKNCSKPSEVDDMAPTQIMSTNDCLAENRSDQKPTYSREPTSIPSEPDMSPSQAIHSKRLPKKNTIPRDSIIDNVMSNPSEVDDMAPTQIMNNITVFANEEQKSPCLIDNLYDSAPRHLSVNPQVDGTQPSTSGPLRTRVARGTYKATMSNTHTATTTRSKRSDHHVDHPESLNDSIERKLNNMFDDANNTDTDVDVGDDEPTQMLTQNLERILESTQSDLRETSSFVPTIVTPSKRKNDSTLESISITVATTSGTELQEKVAETADHRIPLQKPRLKSPTILNTQELFDGLPAVKIFGTLSNAASPSSVKSDSSTANVMKRVIPKPNKKKLTPLLSEDEEPYRAIKVAKKSTSRRSALPNTAHKIEINNKKSEHKSKDLSDECDSNSESENLRLMSNRLSSVKSKNVKSVEIADPITVKFEGSNTDLFDSGKLVMETAIMETRKTRSKRYTKMDVTAVPVAKTDNGRKRVLRTNALKANESPTAAEGPKNENCHSSSIKIDDACSSSSQVARNSRSKTVASAPTEVKSTENNLASTADPQSGTGAIIMNSSRPYKKRLLNIDIENSNVETRNVKVNDKSGKKQPPNPIPSTSMIRMNYVTPGSPNASSPVGKSYSPIHICINDDSVKAVPPKKAKIETKNRLARTGNISEKCKSKIPLTTISLQGAKIQIAQQLEKDIKSPDSMEETCVASSSRSSMIERLEQSTSKNDNVKLERTSKKIQDYFTKATSESTVVNASTTNDQINTRASNKNRRISVQKRSKSSNTDVCHDTNNARNSQANTRSKKNQKISVESIDLQSSLESQEIQSILMSDDEKEVIKEANATVEVRRTSNRNRNSKNKDNKGTIDKKDSSGNGNIDVPESGDKLSKGVSVTQRAKRTISMMNTTETKSKRARLETSSTDNLDSKNAVPAKLATKPLTTISKPAEDGRSQRRRANRTRRDKAESNDTLESSPVRNSKRRNEAKNQLERNITVNTASAESNLALNNASVLSTPSRREAGRSSVFRTLSMQSLTSPTRVKHKVLITGVSDSELPSIIQKLGGSMAEKPKNCTVLVTDRVRRTFKFLCGMALAVPIVSVQWLKDSEKSGHFLDTDDYILDNPVEEAKYGFTLKESLQKASNKKFLEGYTVVLTPNIAPPPIAEMKDMIQTCGGKPLIRPPSNWPENCVIMSRQEDSVNAKKIFVKAPKSVHLVTTEFILTGILRQELNFEEHKLTT